MRRILLVAHREFMQNVQTKGFWFGILFFPILLTAFIAVPQLLERTKSARSGPAVSWPEGCCGAARL